MSYLLNHLGSICYHSKPLDVPCFLNQFLGQDFFCCFLQQDTALTDGGTKVSKPYCLSVLIVFHNFSQFSLNMEVFFKFIILFENRVCDTCQDEFPMAMEKISYHNHQITIAYFFHNCTASTPAPHIMRFLGLGKFALSEYSLNTNLFNQCDLSLTQCKNLH